MLFPHDLMEPFATDESVIEISPATVAAMLDIGWPAAEVDTDSDGIFDAVEVGLGLDPQNKFDANYDYDGDGVSNIDELQQSRSIWVAEPES